MTNRDSVGEGGGEVEEGELIVMVQIHKLNFFIIHCKELQILCAWF